MTDDSAQLFDAPEPDWLRTNRANWDDRAGVHAASAFYDLPGFRTGADTLRPFEPTELGEVSGRRLLHLQCHLGQDTLSWARRGARVTGVDFSAPAVETARSLAHDTGLAERARFVVADVYSAPEALAGERFDVVYTGVGALCWLPDLTRWAEVVATLLGDGGVLYLLEFHPVTDMLDDDGRAVSEDYFASAPQTWDEPTTYTDGPPLENSVSVQWQHTLGDVVSAVAAAGLRLEFLHEHDTTLFPRYRVLRRAADGSYHFPEGSPRIPMMYSLRASR